jgi:hypothetical protein
MSRWIKETGFLNEDGEKAVQGFRNALRSLLSQPEAQAMDERELRTLSCVLHNIVGGEMSNEIREEKQISGPLDGMTDEQFDNYLEAKYGAEWMTKALQPDEIRRAMACTSVIDMIKGKLGSELITQPQHHGVVWPGRGPTYK